MVADCAGAEAAGHDGAVPPTPEPTLALAQARSRWGDGVAVAGLFRPGPDPDARTALGRVVSRRANRRRAQLPARLLVALDGDGRVALCPYAPDPQGGHPDGDDIYTGPFEELGAVAVGPLTMVLLLDADRACVLEAVWLDRDAATLAALLTGEPLPEEEDELGPTVGKGAPEDEESPYAEALQAQADAAQARADVLQALARAALAEEAEESGRPLPPQTPEVPAPPHAAEAPESPERPVTTKATDAPASAADEPEHLDPPLTTEAPAPPQTPAEPEALTPPLTAEEPDAPSREPGEIEALAPPQVSDEPEPPGPLDGSEPPAHR